MVYAACPQSSFRLTLLFCPVFALLLILFCNPTACAIPLAEYRKGIEKTISALDTVNLRDESESLEDYQSRFIETLNSIRTLLPLRQSVEWDDAIYEVDNTWLHQHLGEFEKAAEAERATLLTRMQDRLKALYERLMEIEKKPMSGSKKAEAKRKLQDILSRSEYAKKATEESALARLWVRFLRWLSNVLPRPQRLEPQPGSAQRITTVSQIFVVFLSLAVLAFVLKAFVTRIRRTRGSKKEQKLKPRVVLGERLEPEQSASDLLTEAETLARNGQIRTAIRKAYIALLVELGDRKVISLAQHKTNRDYLSALRDRESLHRKMISLTNSFERHWYGLDQATERDWLDFRARFREALQE
jgi:hypothetical protein